MPNTTHHHPVADHADHADHADLQTAAVAAPAPSSRSLPPLPAATRLAALALAVLTTSLVLGSQLGLTAMYAAQADAVMAKAKPAKPDGQRVAQAN